MDKVETIIKKQVIIFFADINKIMILPAIQLEITLADLCEAEPTFKVSQALVCLYDAHYIKTILIMIYENENKEYKRRIAGLGEMTHDQVKHEIKKLGNSIGVDIKFHEKDEFKKINSTDAKMRKMLHQTLKFMKSEDD